MFPTEEARQGQSQWLVSLEMIVCLHLYCDYAVQLLFLMKICITSFKKKKCNKVASKAALKEDVESQKAKII